MCFDSKWLTAFIITSDCRTCFFFHLRLHRSLSSLKYGSHSTGGAIHLSILKSRAIFHRRGGPWKASFFKVWDAASAKILHQSIPVIQISMHLIHMTSYLRMTSYSENRGCVRSCPTVPIYSKINGNARIRTPDLEL